MVYDNSNLILELKAREKDLLEIIDELRTRVAEAPEGKLRIAHKGEKIQYYHREKRTDKTGKYIRCKDTDMPRLLAQGDYDSGLLKAAISELKVVRKLIESNMLTEINNKTKLMSAEKLKLITSLDDLRRNFIEKWSIVDYDRRIFRDGDPEYYASDGTRVHSKSEVIILDTYLRHNIPCHYEKPLVIGDAVFRPDFYLLNTRTMKSFYHEHLGMMGNSNYAAQTIKKLKFLEKNGIVLGKNLFVTMEAEGIPINYKDVEIKIKEFLV